MGVNFTVKEHQRLAYVDDIKGLTIISVVFYHVIAHFFLLHTYPEIDNIFGKIIEIHAMVAMQVFALLSGLVFAMAYCDDNRKLQVDRYKRQLLNIFGVYVTFSLLWGILKLYLPNYFMPYDVVSVQSMYMFLIVPLPLCHMWFRHMMLLLYLVAGVNCFRQYIINHFYFMLAFMLVIVPLICSQLTGDLFLSIRNVLIHLGSFFIGMFYYYNKNALLFNIRMGVLCFALSTILFILLGNKNSFVHMIISEGWTIGFFVLFAKGIVHCSWLEYIGEKCLDIYIWHFFFVAVVGNRLFSICGNYGILVISATTILCTILPLIFSHILKMVGFYQWFFKPGNAYLAKRR